jgi:hypothetical protein
VSPGRASGDTGPGILETSLILAAALLLAFIIVFFFGGQLAAVVGALVDIAHGGR